jgi:hypothetical protein
MTTGRINQVTILKTTAKLNTRPRPLALQRVRSNSRKFQIDMKLQRHRSQGSSARCAAHWTCASYSPPRSFPSCISLRAADLAKQSRCRESPRSERTFGGCFLLHSHVESRSRQSPSSVCIRFHNVNRYTLSFSLHSGSRGWCAWNSSMLDSSQIGRNRP